MTPPLACVALILALLLPCATRAADDKKKDGEKNPQIKVDDGLEVTILNLQGPGTTTTVKPIVDKNGKVEIPRLNPVAANGLTCEQLETAIKKAYRDANLFANADVSVEFASPEGADKRDIDQAKATEKNPVIKVDDRLEVTILDLQGPGVKTTVKPVVDKKGEIKLPYLNRVAAKGLTCKDLETAIVKAYRDGNLIANATVSVEFAKEKKEYEGL